MGIIQIYILLKILFFLFGNSVDINSVVIYIAVEFNANILL